MQCELCGAAFEPTAENPGTTYVGGYADDSRVETLRLCHECVGAFHAMSMDDQHATVEHAHTAHSETETAPEATAEPSENTGENTSES